MNHSTHYILLNGITGVSASSLAFIATLVQDVEAWIRLTTSFFGLIIALITLINLIQKRKQP